MSDSSHTALRIYDETANERFDLVEALLEAQQPVNADISRCAAIELVVDRRILPEDVAADGGQHLIAGLAVLVFAASAEGEVAGWGRELWSQ